MTDRLAFIRGLIGKPYRRGGEGPDAFDCWGLVAHVQGALFGRAVPQIHLDADEEPTLLAYARAFADHPEYRRWRLVAAPADGSVVTCARVDRPVHAGTFLTEDGGGILHADERAGILFEPVDLMRRRGFTRLAYYVPAF